MPVVLALDTATWEGSVAIVENDRVLAEASERVTAHSERILPLCDQVLRQAGLTLAQVDAVACGLGPGTFTGLRIGVATAKGLCYALGKPIVGVSSLAALAMNAPRGKRMVVPVIDARKQEVFAGFYCRDGGDPRALWPEAVVAPARLRDRVAGEDALLLGCGVAAYREVFDGLRLFEGDAAIRATSVGRLALARLRRGETDDLARIEPTYIRPSDAELGRAR